MVSRPSKWGNPFPVGSSYYHDPVRDRAHAADLYSTGLIWGPSALMLAQRELGGRDLACWCPLDDWCHADFLLTIANPGLTCPWRWGDVDEPLARMARRVSGDPGSLLVP